MGKIPVLIAILFTFAVAAHSQKAMTFQQANDGGISTDTLDTLYRPALDGGPDSARAVFYGRHDEFRQEYFALLKSLARYLKTNNFQWGKTTRCFNRIYFNERGSIDYFLFNFKPGEITGQKQQRFATLLNQFLTDYRFTLPAPAKFSQCSPVVYSD